MKTFKLIGMAMIAIMMCMSFTSCGNEDVVAPEEPQNDDYITVGLGCTGEFLEFSDSPMSRTAEDALYGIQVYTLTEHTIEVPDADGSHIETYYMSTPYAYGMFTSLEDVKIRLLQGKKYKFEVGILVEPFKYGRTHWFEEDYYNYHYNKGTEFTYSLDQEVNAYQTGYSNSDYYKHDRYYGELDEYTPENNTNVNIHTKRVAYGVRYETIGLGTDETFTIEVKTRGFDYCLYSVEAGNTPNEDIYTFFWIRDAWREPEGQYTSEKQLTISWNKANGTVIPMGTYDVTFKRNVKTTIRINAENLNIENGIKVFKEEASMVDDKYIYEITGGSVVEIPVTPGN